MFKNNVRAALGAAFAAGTLLGIAGTGIAATALGSDVFSDVKEGSFYDKAVGEMYSDGVIKGYEGTTRFGPDDFVTRAQVAVMLQRLRDDMEGGSNDDDDDNESSSRRSSSSRSSSSSSSAMSNNPKGIFRFTTTSYTTAENKGTLTIAVVRTGGNEGSVAVDYTLNAGSATAGSDYETISGTLNFSNKETSKTFNVTIKNDSSSEGSENFTVVLSNVTGGASIGTSSATVTITDDESGGSASSGSSSSRSSSTSSNANGTISFGSPTYIFSENATTAVITVQRTGGTNGTVGVNYATSNGSGTSGQEYTSANGTLTFNSGETTKTFNVSLADDSTSDGNKTFNVTLSNITGGASMGTSTASVSIFDNESGAEFGTGSLKFSKGEHEILESSGKAEITIQRVGGTNHTVSVNYGTSNGTAFSGADYTPTSGTVTFAPGESSKVITVPLIKDSTSESDDYFYVELTSPTANALLVTPYTTEVLIVD